MSNSLIRIPTLLLIGGVALALAACEQGGSENRSDPRLAFDTLKQTALKGDGGRLYDLLDSNIRAKQDLGIQMQAQQRETMPAEEKVKWDTISKYKGREAFAKFFTLNKDKLVERFKGTHSVTHVDTLYAVTVQNKETKQSEVVLFRWYNGKYCITTVPEPPRSAPPSQQQPPQQSQPSPPPDGKGSAHPRMK